MTDSPGTGKNLLLPLILITSLFFLWGLANHLNDILLTQFKKVFSLTDLKAGLVQSAFYLGYFLLAIPAALWMKRFGYRAGVVFGLLLYGLGALLFYPAAQVREYSVFLMALFVIASGLAFLETSANPLIIAMGDPATAERRLNFAQSFNPLGAITGVLIGREFILSGNEPSAEELAAMSASQLEQFYQAESHAVQGPYMVLAAVVLCGALLVWLARFPRVATQPAVDGGAGSWSDYRWLLANGRFMAGVMAQFFYVGAQVCIWAFMIRYGQEAMPGTGEKTLAVYVLASLVVFMLGRFVATALMARVRASWLMGVYAAINMGLCAIALLWPSHSGLLALVASCFFMSLMFPTIFALSVKGLGERTKAGSSLLIMAIVGGAVLSALMGWVSDLTSIHTALVVPLACFAVVAAYARSADRHLVAQQPVIQRRSMETSL
ncbi:L-fucose:H+ symporter permease [Cellvibrio japonicus]|uniref:L-fucose permease n=1 Tax=Cellvibrio japonicus (strain Ueda107) TaxID=498211 RepID=B3PBR8_CELJU|nr:L-fucose:H+ symporter permease [Cellvibrio japonicus]ACE85072.1 L-fucose permease [Cellvibrio japonicus Ueda107]QEI11738.1 L-fucose:H+ symporter permease [Cellvibrio japonicus]QEI15312.1 L-fucose:H+ symporter permease [Cellvibrio japonicus]QEI18892.1 L-fucose:H+ symporter permease [Cellvibrio japonicus]